MVITNDTDSIFVNCTKYNKKNQKMFRQEHLRFSAPHLYEKYFSQNFYNFNNARFRRTHRSLSMY